MTSDARPGTTAADAGTGRGMFHPQERDELRERWDAIQGRFVDDPQGSAAAADDLLDDTIDRLTTRWQDRHRDLRRGWDSEDGVETEQLRTTLQRYRDAFESLLAS